MQRTEAAAPLLPPVHPLTGAEPDEKRFQAYYRERNLPVTRAGLVFAVLLIAAVCVVDYTSMDPAHVEQVLPLRLALMLAPMVVALVISWVDAWRSHVSVVVTVAGFLCGVGTFSDSFVAAFTSQPVVLWGNIFFTFFVYLVLGLPFRSSVIAASPILFISIGMGLAYGTPLHKFAYVFFSQLIGMYTSFRLEQDAREIFRNTLKLEAVTRTDPLTSIANRRMFDEFLARAWRQASRDRRSIGLLLVDVDDFKRFNDSQGHQAGDECLCAVATELAASAKRPLDLVARYGGEEFVVVLYDPSDEYVARFGDTLRERVMALNIPHPGARAHDRVTVSVGAGRFHPDGVTTPDAALVAVDNALYAAKNQGRNCVVQIPEAELPAPAVAAR